MLMDALRPSRGVTGQVLLVLLLLLCVGVVIAHLDLHFVLMV